MADGAFRMRQQEILPASVIAPLPQLLLFDLIFLQNPFLATRFS
jgi:hypothetical protein